MIRDEEVLLDNVAVKINKIYKTNPQCQSQNTSLHHKYLIYCIWQWTYVTGEKILITPTATGDRTRRSAWQANTLPRRYKSWLVPQGIQVYHIPITTTYSPSIFLDSSANLNLSTHSVSGHQAHQTGLFTLGARCNRWKNSNHPCHDRGSKRAVRVTGEHSTTSL